MRKLQVGTWKSFTFIELLAVTVIILIFFAMLMPVLSRARGDELYDVSAFRHVDKKFPPVLFLYGDEDRWTEGGAFAKKLKENGNDVEIWYGPGKNHMFFRGDGWYPPTFLRIDHFLRDHGLLEGEPTLMLGPENGKIIPWDVL